MDKTEERIIRRAVSSLAATDAILYWAIREKIYRDRSAIDDAVLRFRPALRKVQRALKELEYEPDRKSKFISIALPISEIVGPSYVYVRQVELDVYKDEERAQEILKRNSQRTTRALRSIVPLLVRETGYIFEIHPMDRLLHEVPDPLYFVR